MSPISPSSSSKTVRRCKLRSFTFWFSYPWCFGIVTVCIQNNSIFVVLFLPQGLFCWNDRFLLSLAPCASKPVAAFISCLCAFPSLITRWRFLVWIHLFPVTKRGWLGIFRTRHWLLIFARYRAFQRRSRLSLWRTWKTFRRFWSPPPGRAMSRRFGAISRGLTPSSWWL